MAERVLITGATGFVGSHIAEAFVEAGYEVRCGIRTSSNLRWIRDLETERVLVDFTRPEHLADTVKGVDIVVHAAGLTSARRDEDYRRINAEGTRRLAEAAAGAGIRRFVFVSSLAARGPDAAVGGDGEHPVSLYGKSKLEAEEHLRTPSGQMEVVALRPTAVYGPRDTDLLPLFKMAGRGFLVLPGGTGILQPIYAADVALATLAAAREDAGFGPHPVAEADRYTWSEVASGLERAFGHPIRVVRLPAAAFKRAGSVAERAARLRGAIPAFDEHHAENLAVHDWTCDTVGTRESLGWRAQVPLLEGLERSVRWYRKAGWI